MRDVAGGVRAAAVAGPTPLEELDGDPFPVDTRSRHAVCARRAADHGYAVTRRPRAYGPRPGHHALRGGAGGQAGSFAAADRVPERALVSGPESEAECRRRGARLEPGCPEGPVYTACGKAGAHRGLSMPTAACDGG
ncbi:hypothetical protein OHT61_27105 [Streptomyces sp. NBC_00178]|uniref:hypothetical protein n=1 Tax=Streptomyces sp. NBC_00178 TaxID=2975672 RepID=UPI002E2D2478|nr:hypothetical protein [Streptomyces sp. NBC_00178]